MPTSILLQLFTVLVTALAFSTIELTLGAVVKGSVLCTDCRPGYDFSGIKVLVKCDKVKKLSTSTTDRSGAFEANIPSNTPTSTVPTTENCLAKLIGGSTQLYAQKKDMVSKIVLSQGAKNSYTALTPMTVSKSRPVKYDSGVCSSKTFTFPPLPPLPSTESFTPVFPIIGIP